MLTISGTDEQNLRWYYSKGYEADMGSRSTMGGILDAIERGASIRFDKEGGVSQRALDACRRYARIRDQTYRCNLTQTAVLQATFGRFPPAHVKGDPKTIWHELVGPLLHTAPSLVPSVARLYAKDLEHAKFSSASAWLQHIAASQKRRCIEVIGLIRSEAEQLVADAVARYRGDGKTEDRTLGLREMALALGKHHSTVSAELVRRAVPVRGRRGPRGVAYRVRVADLEKYAPDIAERLKSSGAGATNKRGLASGG